MKRRLNLDGIIDNASDLLVNLDQLRRKVGKSLDGKTLVVLGRPGVGKSTLLGFLQTEKINPSIEANPTPVLVGEVKMRYGKREATFNVQVDVPGIDKPIDASHWKEPFAKADFAWYLFRADLLLSGDTTTQKQVGEDVEMLFGWCEKLGIARPQVMLIGTWADQLESYELNEDTFFERLHTDGFLRRKATRLDARLVAGSLATNKDATYLLRQIERNLK